MKRSSSFGLRLSTSLFLLLFTFVQPLLAIESLIPVQDAAPSESVVTDTQGDILDEGISDPKEIAKPTWVVSEGSATTSSPVVLGEAYVYPNDSDVSVTFSSLPEVTSSLTIKTVYLTEDQVKVTNAASNVAYDISTDMVDGSFNYDLTLPKVGDSSKVVYAESVSDLVDAKDISNVVENGSSLKIEDLNHFTVFVVIDDGDNNASGNFSAPEWFSNDSGYQGDHKWVTKEQTGKTATWTYTGSDINNGAIFISWTQWHDHATNAKYTSSVFGDVEVDQQKNSSQLITDGDTVWSGWYRVKPTSNYGIKNLNGIPASVTLGVENGVTNGNLSADAVAFVDLDQKPTEVWVDDNYSLNNTGYHFWGYDAFNNIQSAIDAVATDGTINVADGTYEGFSVVGKSNLTISGSGSSNTIIKPTSLISTGIAHKSTSNMLVSVWVNNSTDITIQDLTIKDNGLTPGSGGPDAIVFWNASSGTIEDSNITGTYSINGIQSGQGIALDASGTQNANLTVNNVSISGFQKNGIDAINGNGATNSSTGTINLSVIGGSITGAGATSTIAQNGIVVWNRGGGSVTGTVDGTTIKDFVYTLPSYSASGILAFGDGKIESVKNASFSNCDYYLATGSQLMNATDNNKFDNVAPSSATITQLGAIQDKLLDKLDKSSDSTANSIFILPNTAIATPNNRGIQAAIDAVTTGGTVYVAEGTYNEQISVAKSLHLIGAGAGNSIIKAPNSIPAASDQNSNIVKISGNGVSAEIKGFTITGPGPSSCGSIRSGIFVLGNAYVNIHDNLIQDIRDSSFSSCQNGIGIQIGRQAWSTAGTAIITQNIITGYQKGGIVVDNEGSNAVITNNTVTGVGTTNLIAQNGIQISRGATATLSGNTVTGNSFHNESNSSNWSSAGILLYQSGAVIMSGGNTVTENDLNLYKGATSGLLTLGIESFGASTAPVGVGADIYNDDNIDIDATKVIFIGTIYGIDIENRVFHKIDDSTKGLVTWATVNLNAPVQTGYNINDGTTESEPRNPNQIACTGGYTNINGVSVHWTDVSNENSFIKYIRQYSTNGVNWSGNEVYTNPYTNYRSFGNSMDGKYYSQVRAFYDIDNDNVRDINEPMSAWSNTCSIVYDKITPTISNVNVDKTFVKAGDTVTITADVTDNTGVLAVSADFSNNEDYSNRPTPSSISMTLVSGNMYRATFVIPADWADGQIFVKVAARDLTGSNWVRSTEFKTFLIDNTPPTNPEMSGFNNPTLSCGAIANVNEVTVDWSDSTDDLGSGVKGYNYEIYYPTTTGGRATYGEFVTPSHRRGSLNEGLHQIKVQAVDNAGNVSEWTSLCNITSDTIAPDVQITAPASTHLTGVVEIRGTVTDANPHHYWLVIENSSNQIIAGPGQVNYSTFFTDEHLLSWDTTLLPEGDYTIRLEARDSANNKDSGSSQWLVVTVDHIQPTVDLQLNVNEAGFKAVFSEDVRESDAEDPKNYFLFNYPMFSASNGDLSEDATITYDSSLHTATVTFSDPTTWHISPEQKWGVENIRDLAGNVLAPYSEYSTLMVAPVTTISGIDTNWHNTDVEVELTCTDIDGSGCYKTYYSLNGNTYKEGDTVIVSSNGENTIKFYSEDKAGNPETPKTSGVIKIDKTNPSAVLLSLTSFTQGFAPNTVLALSDSNGLSQVCYSINGVAQPCITISGTSYNWNITDILNAQTDDFTLSYYVVDLAGNQSDSDIATLTNEPYTSEITVGEVLGATDETTTSTTSQKPVLRTTTTLAQTTSTTTQTPEATAENTNNTTTPEVTTDTTEEVKGTEDTNTTEEEKSGIQWWVYALGGAVLLSFIIFLIARRRKEEEEENNIK